MCMSSVKVKKLLLAVALGGFLFVYVAFTSPEVEGACSTIVECEAIMNDAGSNISELTDQQAEIDEDLAQVEYDLQNTMARIENLEDQISGLEDDIETLRQNITQIEGDIEQTESEIATNEAFLSELDLEIEELFDIVARRMRFAHRSSQGSSFLAVLGESDSIMDLVRRVRMLNHMANQDAQVVEDLNNLIATQQIIISNLEREKTGLEENRQALDVQNATLASRMEELEDENETLTAERETLDEEQTALNEQRAEVASLIISASDARSIAAAQRRALEQTPAPEVSIGGGSDSSSSGSGSGTITSGGGAFVIPLEHGRVTCEFIGCYFGHTGIDLANGFNTNTRVFAAATGVVTVSGWHNMYGWYVIVSHNIDGSQYTTLYAHLHQRPFVNVGQVVEQGHVLGTKGSTGNSTGPHLHFEIYRGPFNWPHAINPREYIHFPSSW